MGSDSFELKTPEGFVGVFKGDYVCRNESGELYVEKGFIYMKPEDFRKLGLLAEVNRVFFHPLGLALETGLDSMKIRSTKDPEGMIHTEEGLKNAQKAQRYIELKHEDRKASIGYVVQPLK